MEYLLIGLVWLLNFAISIWNAYAVGKSWVEARAAGGWPRLMCWAGAVMSASGFSWCYLIFLVLAGYHFQYISDLVGIEHVAFGPDTFWGDHVALHRIFAHMLSIKAARGPAFEPVAYVDGLENPTENFRNISAWLVGHGYSDNDIRAVLGGNIYRALQDIWVGP